MGTWIQGWHSGCLDGLSQTWWGGCWLCSDLLLGHLCLGENNVVMCNIGLPNNLCYMQASFDNNNCFNRVIFVFILLVLLCYWCIPLLQAHPFVTDVSLCYPCIPLLWAHPFVTHAFLCYKHIPLLLIYPFVTDTLLCYKHISLLQMHSFIMHSFGTLLKIHCFIRDMLLYLVLCNNC